MSEMTRIIVLLVALTATYSFSQNYSCPNGSYKNSQGNTVCSPSANNAGGATAVCGDGTYSYSQSRQGTCSRHGGVAQWLDYSREYYESNYSDYNNYSDLSLTTQANKSYSNSNNSYKSDYNPEQDFLEIGWQYIWDMHHLRIAGDLFYGTLGLAPPKDAKKDLYSEEEYDGEWIVGIIPRWVSWIWKNDIGSFTLGFGLFGGLGARHTSEETIMRHELGIEFILGYFSLYVTERNFYRIGGGVGLIFYK